MDIEKTLRLVTESQLRAAERADRADERADRVDERMDRAEERANRAEERAIRADERAAERAVKADQRMDKLENKLNKTADLVRAGVKTVAEMRVTQRELQRLHKDLDYKFNALLDAQLRTNEKFDRWLESLRRKNGNGRH